MVKEKCGMQNTTVALLGDLVQDINLIANPLPVSLTFQTIPPTVYKPVDGGIAYLRKIVGSLPLLDAVAPQLSGKSFEQAAIKIYQTWKRFPETLDSERKVWRIERFIGRADPRTRSNNFESLDFVPADILAIEDLGFGFFERCLHRLDAAGTGVSRLEWLARRVNPREIVLKLSSMRHLDAALGQLASLHPVTAVISVKALRERGAAISEGLSWDRTIEDTVGEFQNGLSSRDLAFCKRVVVLFSTEGAAAFEREDHRCRLKQFVYHPSQHEGTFKSRCPGTISGDLAILTAAVIQHLADPCSFPLFVALALAVSAMRDHQARGGITEVKGKKDPVDRFDFEEPISAIAEILSLPIDFKRLEGEWLRSDLEGGQGEAKGEEINQKKRKLAGLLGAFSTTFRHEILYQEEMQQRKDDESNLLCDTTGFGTEYVAAKAFDVVMRGPREALRHVPMAIYGKYLTVDREEIERINSLKKLILSYRESPGDTRPLSIAVFGPPGSGKSFAIKP